MTPDVVIDVGIAPEGVLGRLSVAINQRPKRAFGVLKTHEEFIGAVAGDHFEIWERSQRAVHAVGRVQARRGGARLEMRFVFPPVTRVLIVVFFGLYVVAAAGIATLPAETTVSPAEFAIALGGVLLLGAGFTAAAIRQRAALRRFVERLFQDVVRS